jgi:ParB-like nuclease domain
MSPATLPVFRLPLAQLGEDLSFNLRIFYGDIDELAVRLMTEGQREAIKVRDENGDFYVVDGHRRRRAFTRALQLRIEPEDGRYLVYDGSQPLREAPGPVHPNYAPQQVLCCRVECGTSPEERFASQLIHNLGQPFTLLERSLFLSRLLRHGGGLAESSALKIGFSPLQIAEARLLHAADPRLLEQVCLGRLSQKLALRLLRTFPAVDQIARLMAARAAAERQQRDYLLPHDFDWSDEIDGVDPQESESAEPSPAPLDPVHARFNDLINRLGEAAHAAPNHAAEERLGTLLLIHRYAIGQIGYDRLEAHLFGRQ